jgi:hypothetical protein
MPFLGGVIRVLLGFVAASFAAGAVQVLFALTPAELISGGPEYWTEGGLLLLGTVTITGLFAAPFVFVSALISEWRGIRSFAYHGLAGIVIAMVGHALLYSGQNANEPSIVNSYAAAAYLTAGLVGGFAYWGVAGRRAYRRRGVAVGQENKAVEKIAHDDRAGQQGAVPLTVSRTEAASTGRTSSSR